jgi:glycosyltransferase involved in cell wall biosynthesis
VKKPRAVVEVCSYHGPYPGTFIPTLIAVGEGVRTRLGLDYHCVFPAAMRDRPWVRMLGAADIGTTFIDPGSRAGAVRDLARIVRAQNASLVRSHFSRWDVEAGVAGRSVRAASVWHMHSGRFGLEATRARGARDAVKARALGGLCDRVITVSDALHRAAIARGFPERKVSTVWNGIDAERFERLPPRPEARAALGITGDATVALSFAWSPHTKGTDVLVDAVRALGTSGALVLVLVGHGAALTSITGSPLPSWIRVVAPRDDVETLFSAADVFVSASREEGFSYAIGEAMASGLPVVSSDIPGPAAYFSAAGVTTFRSEDASDLEAVLRRTCETTTTERLRLGEANRDFIRTRLSLPVHVDGVLTAFAELL